MKTRTVRLLVGYAVAGMMATATLAGVALAQGQPTTGAPAWLRARLEHRLDARTRVAVERVIDSAWAAGIPAEALVSKALQGAAMGASSDNIVKAVRHLAGTIAVARRALGPQSLPTELDGGVAALTAGVDADVLTKLRKDREKQPLAVALGVLADLIGRGVPTKDATQTVLALTRVGTTDEQLVAFQRDVERDIGIGSPPASAVNVNAKLLLIISGDGGPSNQTPARPPRGRQKP